jgi:hypothetical protein
VNYFKKIFHHHEEFSHVNILALRQLMTKFREFEELMDGLTRRMEENFGEFKVALATLSCRLDEMDVATQ